MNFRTTVILLLILGVLGALALLTRNGSKPPAQTEAARKLFSLTAADIVRVDLTTPRAETAALERTAEGWNMQSPVSAPADVSMVESLLSSILGLSSQGQVELKGLTADLGLDAPTATIRLTPRSGPAVTLQIGAPARTGGNVYVRLNDSPHAELVPSWIVNDLEKPVWRYREARLLRAEPGEIHRVSLAAAEKPEIVLEKQGEEWRLTAPISAPAERSSVESLLRSIVALRAEAFVSENAGDAGRYDLDTPVFTVSISRQPATTQPVTTAPAAEVIRFGRYDDLLKRNVFAMAGESGPIVKLPASSLTALEKAPLDLRDRRVLDLSSSEVRRISISTESAAATQPATAVILERVSEGAPATTTSTEPAKASWRVVSPEAAEADPTAVEALLRAISPLRVNRYLASLPTVSVSDWRVLRFETTSGEHLIRLRVPADNAFSVEGSMGDTNFELSRQLYDAANASFAKPAPTASPESGQEATQPS
ncbi:MAG: DUF4340 domain-containing protein [Phycisphaerae bacterium]|nr:DUF4340 domain-containing protein [Phycisphaerae bacterium]MDW8261968.1 DUF4340 domain-containing protein [Phycisphaerales bacterium]